MLARLEVTIFPSSNTFPHLKLVDPTGIKPATDALQMLLAPEEHASP